MDTELLEYLTGFITQRRNSLFNQVLEMRTRYITLALEDIYQPNNASAVLRTCDCFGIQDVHVIENKNEYELDKEVTMGAQKWINIYRYNQPGHNTTRAVKELRKNGYRIVAATPHENNQLLHDIDVTKGKLAIFLGTELTGLSPTLIDQADEFLKIPMYGFTESFNISVSAALILQSVVNKLHVSDINWHLSTEEKNRIKLDWIRKSIKKVDLIEKKYLEKKK